MKAGSSTRRELRYGDGVQEGSARARQELAPHGRRQAYDCYACATAMAGISNERRCCTSKAVIEQHPGREDGGCCAILLRKSSSVMPASSHPLHLPVRSDLKNESVWMHIATDVKGLH